MLTPADIWGSDLTPNTDPKHKIPLIFGSLNDKLLNITYLKIHRPEKRCRNHITPS